MCNLSDANVCPKFSQAQSEGDGGGKGEKYCDGGGGGKRLGPNRGEVKIQTSCSTILLKNTCPERRNSGLGGPLAHVPTHAK